VEEDKVEKKLKKEIGERLTGGVHWYQVESSLTVLSWHPTYISNSFNQKPDGLTPTQKLEMQPNTLAPSPKTGLDPTQPTQLPTKTHGKEMYLHPSFTHGWYRV